MLTSFRNLWQKEISNDAVEKSQGPAKEASPESDEDIEGQARRLFMQGVENEQKGRLYEAIQFYRKAVQLVPDVEFKLFDSARNIAKERAPDPLDNNSGEKKN